MEERPQKRQRTESASPVKKQDGPIQSLVNRMAGPSTTKAGLLKDQSEVNRIIYESSKGSKFFHNEARKDEQLTRKIAATKEQLKKFEGRDFSKEDAHVDKVLATLEATRDLSRYIVLVDADAFYISVELLGRPDLKGKPCAVGGGVITASSYEARKFGVRSAMAEFIARKLCPQLIVLKSNFDKYIDYAKRMREVFAKFDPNYSPMSLDEAYLDVTSYMREHKLSATDAVELLRREIFTSTGLTVSAGIGPNKFIAKVAADKNKPNGQYCVPNERKAVMDFTRDLPIRKVPGIGRVTERVATDAYNIHTCKDIYIQRGFIYRAMSETTFQLMMRTYLGLGTTEVRPAEEWERKSMGHESTFRDISATEDLYAKLREIAESLEKDLAAKNIEGRTISLKLKRNTYEVLTRDWTLSHPIYTADDLFKYGSELLQRELPITVRLMGLKMSKLQSRDEPENGLLRFFKNGKVDAHAHTSEELDLDLFDIGDIAVPNVAEESQNADVKEEMTCPICSKTLHMNNFQMNAHIDLCMNADALQEYRKPVPSLPKKAKSQQDPIKPMNTKFFISK